MKNNVERNFPCENEKSFKSNSSLCQHIKTVHGEEKPFICNVCNENFPRQDELKIHNENNHHGRDHICKLCGKSFPGFRSLRHHIRAIHDGERKYECNSCGKLFTKSSLKKPILAIHEEQRQIHENLSQLQHILQNTSRQYMKDKEITNVILMENPTQLQVI